MNNNATTNEDATPYSEFLGQVAQRLLLIFRNAESTKQALTGLNESGTVFAVFILVTDVDLTAGELLKQFHASHIGTFANWDDAVDNLTSMLGWKKLLGNLRTEGSDQVMDFLVLTWDEEAVRRRLSELFMIVEINGHLHVFDRAE